MVEKNDRTNIFDYSVIRTIFRTGFVKFTRKSNHSKPDNKDARDKNNQLFSSISADPREKKKKKSFFLASIVQTWP